MTKCIIFLGWGRRQNKQLYFPKSKQNHARTGQVQEKHVQITLNHSSGEKKIQQSVDDNE